MLLPHDAYAVRSATRYIHDGYSIAQVGRHGITLSNARSQALYDAVGSPDKTLKLYEGLLHEIFNEPEHPQVMADLAAWLEAHV